MKRNTFIAIIIALSFVYLWSFRGYYTEKFNSAYINDLFDHSQWNVPDSVRSLGDDGLYQVAGYRLVFGGKLYSVAAEVPPLGKYIVGTSLKYLHNGALVAIPFAIVTVIIFYALSGYFLKSQQGRYIATLLFVASPQVINNSYRATFDLYQLCFLLLHIWLVLKSIYSKGNKKPWLYAVGAGIALGCFISIKIGLFCIPVLIADAYLLYKNKKTKLILPIIFTMPVVYIATTMQFFIQGGNLTEWISAQKWIINFYRNSNFQFIPFMAIITLLTSLYKGWWNSGWESTIEWTILMPLGTGIFFYTLFKKYHTKSHSEPLDMFLHLYTLISLSLLCVISFWPRYLILIMPFLIIYIVKFWPEHTYKKQATYAIYTIVVLQTFSLLFPQPTEMLASYTSNMQNATYQEVYGLLDTTSQSQTSRDLFWKELLELDKDLHLESKEVTTNAPFTFPWQTQATAEIITTYKTPLGEFTHDKDVTLIRQNNQWKIKWSWDTAAPHFSPTDTIETKIEYTNAPQTPYIFITPEKVTDETNLVYDVGELTNQKRYIVIKKYLQNTPTNWEAPIGFVKDNYAQDELQKVSKNPAVTIKNLPKLNKNTKVSGIITLQKKDGRRYVLLYKQ